MKEKGGEEAVTAGMFASELNEHIAAVISQPSMECMS
jgi:hypothetical protein